MKQIVIRKPKTGEPGRLTIDIVLNSQSGLHHLGRATYGPRGLYVVAQTHKCRDCPIDIHTSYHHSGEMHCKLTRGKLFKWPPGQFLGQAQPHTKDKAVLLWQRKGQFWDSLKGIEKLDVLHPKGCQGFTNNTEAQVTSYPIYTSSDEDYVFKIDIRRRISKMIDIQYFLVEVGDRQSIEAEIIEIIDSQPNESVTVEKAELFTNLSPWFAIVVFAMRDHCST